MSIIDQATGLTKEAFATTDKTEKHSMKVFSILKNRFQVKDEEILAAGITHDILEDTNVTIEELEMKTSKRVADIVQEISHAKGATRLDKVEFYRRLPTVSNDAKLVKLADYLANLEWNIEVIKNHALDKHPFLKDPTDYINALKVFLDSCREIHPEATTLVTEVMEEVEGLSR
ncbi:MAG: HD domain-containing protein [bacterium]|nr:HD domain-containing protein [bacterium]